MRSGELDRPITIQEPSYTQDPTGQELETWSTWLSCYCKWLTVTSPEQFLAEGMHSRQLAKVTIRFKEGIHGKMRIIHEGKIYRIVGYAEMRRDRKIEIGVELWA